MRQAGGSDAASAAAPEPATTARLSAVALGLALGAPRPPEIPAPDWAALLELARRERCAALAWLRSEALLRAHAPPDVVERWRQLAIATAARGHAQLAVAAEAASLLERSGVRVVTLKGAPLAVALYGDPTVRACTDVDWFVEPCERLRARAALEESGWRLAEGAPPWDETFERASPHGFIYIEVHSSLLHPRLAYLPVPPPESERAEVAGATIWQHCGALVPAYLAAHLAGHPFPPLLWHLDFLTLWDGLGGRARADARASARRAGLGRYLAWAERRADAVRRVAEGDTRSLRTLGVAADRAEPHAMWRHLWLAPTPSAVGRALAAWVWPVWARGDATGVAGGVLRRAARYWRDALRRQNREAGTAPARSDAAPPAVARVEATALLEVARDVVDAGGQMWVEVTGDSMLPALAPGDRVLLDRAGGPLQRGDVVLADSGDRPVLHRVVSCRGGLVTTRGDACLADDEPLARSRVVARVVAVRRVAAAAPAALRTPSLAVRAAGNVRRAVACVGRARRRGAET